MDLLERVLRSPTALDDKYSRGVVGFVTGSAEYPGAAILGVTAAMRAGVGMVRYIGPETVGNLLLEVRPEVVLQDGRAQCWVLGSGVLGADSGGQAERILEVLSKPGYAVIDAGALEIARYDLVAAQCILTPHAGELSTLLRGFGQVLSRIEVEADPVHAAVAAAKATGQVVLLKGSVSTVSDPHGESWQTPAGNPALATAGTGDVLAGLIGALVAANESYLKFGDLSLADIALAAAILHSQAADRAALEGPVVALDVAEAIRSVVGERLA